MQFYFENFRRLRRVMRWSQSALAKKLNVARSTVSSWENGKTLPAKKQILRIAEILKVDVAEIATVEKEYPVSEIDIKEQAEIFLNKTCPLTDSMKEIKSFGQYVAALNKRISSTSIILKAFLSVIHTPIYIKDIEHKYIIVNDAFMKLIGNKMSSFSAGSTDYTFFNKAEASENLEMDKAVIKYGKRFIDIETHIPGTRKSKIGLISKYPIFDDNRKICGLIGVFIDITERKKTEAYLRVLDYALNQINDCIWIARSDGHVNMPHLEYINNAIEDLTGFSKNDIIANPSKMEKILSSYYHNVFNKLDPSANYPIQKHYSFKNSDDHNIPVNEKIYYCGDNYFLGIIHDNSKKEKKCHFKELLEVYDDLVDDGIFIYDELGEFLFINKNNEEIFGYKDSVLYKHGFRHWADLCVKAEFRDNLLNIFPLKSKKITIIYDVICLNGKTKKIKSKISYPKFIKGKKCFVQVNNVIS